MRNGKHYFAGLERKRSRSIELMEERRRPREEASDLAVSEDTAIGTGFEFQDDSLKLG
jgi:hypothetical protein